MNCKEFENYIFEHIEGSLDESENARFLAHKEDCVECAKMYNFVADGYNIIREEKKVEINPFLYTRIRGKLQTPAKRRTVLKLMPAFATVLVLGLMFGFLISTLTMKPQNIGYQEYELAELFNEMQIENVESVLLND